MNVTVNGRAVGVEAVDLTVRELLETMKYSFPLIVVKVNGQLVRKEEHAEFRVRDGDAVEAIHLMGGG